MKHIYQFIAFLIISFLPTISFCQAYNTGYPDVVNIDATTTDVITNIDTDGYFTSFIILEASEPAPTIQNVLDWSYDGNGGTLPVGTYGDIQTGRFGGNANTEYTFNASSLSASTNYVAYFVSTTNYQPATAIEATNPTSVSFSTLSPPGPNYNDTYPKISNISETGVTLLTNINTDGYFTSFVILEASEPSPTIQNVLDWSYDGNGGTLPTDTYGDIQTGRFGGDADTEYSFDASNLSALTDYVVYFVSTTNYQPATAIETSSPTSISFQTTGPVLINAYLPEQNATNVPVNQNPQLTFNQDIQWSTITLTYYIRIYEQSTGMPIQNFIIEPGNIDPLLDISNNQITINLRQDLDINTNYYITIPNGVIESTSGTPFAGINNSESNNWRFTTVGEPIWTASYPFTENLTLTNIDFVGQTDKDGTYNYVVTASATPPSVAQIKNGQDDTGAAALITNSGTPGAMTGSVDFGETLDISSFSSETTYYIYLVATSTQGSLDSEVRQVPFTTLNFAPIWAIGYPFTENLTLTNIDFVGQTDKNGTYNYVVTSSATAPSISQIKNGQDETGAAALITNSATPGAMVGNVDFVENLDISGLSAETTYYIYSVATSTQGSVDSEIKQTPFTTLERNPPVASFVPSNGSSNISVSTNVIITFDEPVRLLNGTIIDDTNIGGLISFLLSPSTPVPFTATIDASKTVVTIIPNTSLNPNSSYDVTIAAVEDYYGNEQLSSSTTSFTTDDFITWNGNESSIWNSDGNWSDPYADGLSVLIPNTATRMPQIDNLVTDVQNLIIEAGASLTVTSTGDLTVAGDLTLNSSNDPGIGNASLVNLGAVTVDAAHVFIHQSISSPTLNYNVSSPVSGATQTNIGCDNAMYSYSNSTDSWVLESASAPMTTGKGYVLRSGSNLVFSGAINFNSNYLIPVTRTAGAGLGWNLVGNPYTSAINWDLIDAGLKVNLVDAIWIYLNDQGIYGTYSPVGGGINLTSGEIPSNHAFWIKVLEGDYTNGSLTIPRSSLIENSTTILKSAKATMYPRIKLAGINKTYKDETVVAFADIANDAEDKFDAEKKFSSNSNYFQIFTSEPFQSLAINSKAALQDHDVSIQLGYKAPAAGNYTIKSLELSNIPVSSCVLLEDTYLNKTINLSDQPSYSFILDKAEFNNDRFLLHVKNEVSTSINNEGSQDDVLIYGLNQVIIIEGQDISMKHFEIISLDGKIIKKGQIKANLREEIPMNKNGLYIIRLFDANNSKAQKVLLK